MRTAIGLSAAKVCRASFLEFRRRICDSPQRKPCCPQAESSKPGALVLTRSVQER
jgi:hypothetical protein